MHTTYICKIKEENLPTLSVYRIWRKSLRTQERVRLIHGKRAIGVRAIEILLYCEVKMLNRLCRRIHDKWCTLYFIYDILQTQTSFSEFHTCDN